MQADPQASLMQAAIADHQAGRFADAEAKYRRVLTAIPGHGDALHMLGLLAYQTGQHDRAVDLLRQALIQTPQHAPCYNSLGKALRAQGLTDEAIASYRRAIEIRPDFAEAHANLGHALQSRGRFQEALECHQRALALAPDHAHGHYNLGNLFMATGEFARARGSYQRALELRPDFPEAEVTLGNALHSLGQLDEALACYRRALALRPGLAEAWNYIGLVQAERHCYDTAIESLRKALEIRADYAEGWQTIGTLYEAKGQHETALECFCRSVALKPDFATAHNNIGNSLLQLGDLQGSLAAYRRALELEPDFPDALSNLGNLLRTLGRLEESIAFSDRALELRPGWADAEWNKAVTLLLAGNYGGGWRLAESRWKFDDPRRVRRPFSSPPWLGDEPLQGRTLLLHHEQGLGDTLQMLRYASLLARQGAHVVVLVPRCLATVAATAPGVAAVVVEGEDLPAFDLHCPFMSLPLACRTTLATVPADVPYLFAPEVSRAAWQSRLGPANRRRIGIAWTGSTTHRNDRHRSLTLRQLQPLIQADAEFISLQKEYREQEIRTERPEDIGIKDFSTQLHDFSDTAGLIAHLDLVICVDTSVAHLAGGMATPTWLLLPYAPDYRWMLGRRDSPWYPTLRLFRQPEFGDWQSVIQAVLGALENECQAGTGQPMGN